MSAPAQSVAIGVRGVRVRYRFWDSQEFHTGTVARVWIGGMGTGYVDIKRDGYRETAVMPLEKFVDPNLVVQL